MSRKISLSLEATSWVVAAGVLLFTYPTALSFFQQSSVRASYPQTFQCHADDAMVAGAFYGFTTILLPYNQPHAKVVELLRQTNADALVAQAGSLPLDELINAGASVTEVIWVAERASRHVGWGDVPESIGRKIGVSVWHELVKENRNSATELPTVESGQKPGNIVAVWQGRTGAENQVVEFTQGVSASNPDLT